MSQIIHYQTQDRKAYCYGGERDNTTSELSQVTCQNCISKKRSEGLRNSIDWDQIKRDTFNLLSKIKSKVNEFCLEHNYRSLVFECNYPPSISIQILVSADKITDKRIKTKAYNIGTYAQSNIIRVLEPKDDDLARIGQFIADLSQSLGLRCYRTRGTGTIPLSYDLKLEYKRKH